MSEEDENQLKIKVVLIGESGVGKTSIISRFITNIFNPLQIPTTAASYVSKTVEIENGKNVKFELWDTAGQERYRSIARIFYQNAAVCILVYDITRKSSFEEIKKYWVKEVKSHIKDDASKKYIINIYILISFCFGWK